MLYDWDLLTDKKLFVCEIGMVYYLLSVATPMDFALVYRNVHQILLVVANDYVQVARIWLRNFIYFLLTKYLLLVLTKYIYELKLLLLVEYWERFVSDFIREKLTVDWIRKRVKLLHFPYPLGDRWLPKTEFMRSSALHLVIVFTISLKCKLKVVFNRDDEALKLWESGE